MSNERQKINTKRKKKGVLPLSKPSSLILEQEPIGVITQILSYLDYCIGGNDDHDEPRYVSKKWLVASRKVPHITLNWRMPTWQSGIEERKPMESFRLAIQHRPRVVSFMNFQLWAIDPLLESPNFDSIWSSFRDIKLTIDPGALFVV
jgi:hypothetical protein